MSSSIRLNQLTLGGSRLRCQRVISDGQVIMQQLGKQIVKYYFQFRNPSRARAAELASQASR